MEHKHEWVLIEGDTVAAYCKICPRDRTANTWDKTGCAHLTHKQVENILNNSVGLRELWNRLCQRMWDSWEIDGGTFQDWGEELGLLRKEKYDPEVHGMVEADPGDEIFVNALKEVIND